MQVLWSKIISEDGRPGLRPFSTRPNPCLIDDLLILALFAEKAIQALRISDQQEVWTHSLDYLASEWLIPWNGRVLGGTSRTVLALDAETGTLVWEYSPYGKKGEKIYAEPALLGETAIFGDRRGRVHCLRLHDGSPRWVNELDVAYGKDINSTGVIRDGVFFSGTNSGYAFALNAVDGDVIWTSELDSPVPLQPVLSDDRVFLMTCSAIHVLDAQTGEVQRVVPLGPGSHWDLVVAGEDLAIPSWLPSNPEDTPTTGLDKTDRSVIQVIDPADKRKIIKAPFSQNLVHPIDDGRLLFCSSAMGYQIRNGISLEIVHEEVATTFEETGGLCYSAIPFIRDGVFYCFGMVKGKERDHLEIRALDGQFLGGLGATG